MKIIRNAVFVLSTGFIFFYFSELLFWSRVRPDDSLGNWLSTWIAYSLMAFIFLFLIQHFRVNNIWALFLAGAAFGWMAEGIIVQTAYEMLPLSISFTGLSWHALITVWVGWYALRESLADSNPFSTLKLAAVIGFCYGLWAISWWVEPDGGVSSVTEFSAYTLMATVLLMAAYWLANLFTPPVFSPKRWVLLLISAAFVLYFAFVTLPAVLLAILILPILMGLITLALRKNRLRETGDTLIQTLKGKASPWKYLSLLALPVVSAAVYWLASRMQLTWHTNQILYILTTPSGFILFTVSFSRLWRGGKKIQNQ